MIPSSPQRNPRSRVRAVDESIAMRAALIVRRCEKLFCASQISPPGCVIAAAAWMLSLSAVNFNWLTTHWRSRAGARVYAYKQMIFLWKVTHSRHAGPVCRGCRAMSNRTLSYPLRTIDSAFPDLLKTWRELLPLNYTTRPGRVFPVRSDTHAWSAHPTADLLGVVAGIQPASPGFASVRIAPHLGDLTNLTARVRPPTRRCGDEISTARKKARSDDPPARRCNGRDRVG